MSYVEPPPAAGDRRGGLAASPRRYLWFLGPGVILLACAIFIALFTPYDYEIFAHIAADLGVTLSAIAFIDFVWFRLGGTPVERQVSAFSVATDDALSELHKTTAALQHFQQSGIKHLEDQIGSLSETTSAALSQLRTGTAALGDLQTLGITRLYSERIRERTDRISSWYRRLSAAKEVDLMGLTLWEEWFDHRELRQALQDVIARGGIVRVVLLPKDNDDRYSGKTLRMKQPGELARPKLLPGLLEFTYEELDKILGRSQADNPGSIEVRIPHECVLYSLILRIDSYAFIAPYVASEVGEDSFAFEIEGAEKSVFVLYKGEFESVFGNSLEYKPMGATSA